MELPVIYSEMDFHFMDRTSIAIATSRTQMIANEPSDHLR